MSDEIKSMNLIRCTKCGEEFALITDSNALRPTLIIDIDYDWGIKEKVLIRCPKCGHEEEIM